MICVGEALVDFLPADGARKRVREIERWAPCLGGSPANVAVGVARLGGRSALLGVTGEDEFGAFLKEGLSREGVDVSRLRQTEEGRTGLVFVSLTESGERSFTFFRTRAAEQFLAARDVDLEFLASARAMHCGSNSLLLPEAQRAVLAMARATHQAGRILSCDPNLRLHLWKNPEELKSVLYQIIPLCSVVKVSVEELGFVTGEDTIDEGLLTLRRRGVTLPVVTSGPGGAHFLWGNKIVHLAAPRVQVVDTTGAGDGFVAAMLRALLERFPTPQALREAPLDALKQILAFASEAAGRVCEHLGAVAGLPRASELPFPGALERK